VMCCGVFLRIWYLHFLKPDVVKTRLVDWRF
jgi:hypothetical protein